MLYYIIHVMWLNKLNSSELKSGEAFYSWICKNGFKEKIDLLWEKFPVRSSNRRDSLKFIFSRGWFCKTAKKHIRELMRTTFVSFGRKPEVNILHARPVVSPNIFNKLSLAAKRYLAT